MNLIKRNESPFDALAKRFFGNDDFFKITPGLFMAENNINVGKTNILNRDDVYIVQMSVPGFKKDDITIDVDDDVLTISSEIVKSDKEKNDNFYRKEFVKSSFSRSFYVPEDVDAKKIDAYMEDGILNVSFPKKELKKKENKISIKIK